jgi:hypothetical protein
MNLLEAGLLYLKRGMPVFPFKRDKSEACVKWKQYNEIFPSSDDVKSWFTKRFSHEFIAIVTGKISNIMVVDIDSEEAYQNFQEFLPENLVTPIVKTKRGYHIYFEYKPGLVSKADYMKDVDVRTDGGCIIAPPSCNGHGVEYKWLPGLSIEKIPPAPMPAFLYDTLLQSLGSLIITSNSKEYANTQKEETNGDIDYKRQQFFTEGRRDQDLFHVANCLIKGKCEKELSKEVIKILAKNCTPAFPEKEADKKFDSAQARQTVREGNLAAEIRDWVLTTNGVFLTTNAYKELHLTTRDERKNVAVILKRLKDDGIIEKAGKRNGEWRLVDQDCKPMDWINADCNYKDLWLPMGLDRVCGVQPGNIMVIAGAKDSGKTAFLLNCAKENRHQYKIHYFNSEMGAAEFKMRVSKFDDIPLSQWKDVAVYERSENFADVIKSGEGNLNIIDFLEVVDEFWKVAATIQKIHQKLNGALAIIAIQKNPKADLGRGGAFSLEKARLYLSLDYQVAKIISCKNFKENDMIQGNPRGYTTRYKLVNGCKIIKTPPGWTNSIEKEPT